MSSLVVTGGATYEGVDPTNVDSLIVETSSDPELNPEIERLLRPSLGLGYRPEDRNDLLRSVKIESKKKHFRENEDIETKILPWHECKNHHNPNHRDKVTCN